jgi:hypothetical protein
MQGKQKSEEPIPETYRGAGDYWLKSLGPYLDSMFQVFAQVFIESGESNPWMSPWEPRVPVPVKGSMFLIKVDRERKKVLALTNYHVVRFIATNPDGTVKGFARREIRGQKQDIGFRVKAVIPMESESSGGDLAVVELNPKILENGDDNLRALPWLSDLFMPQGAEVAAIDYSKGLPGGAKITVGHYTGVVNGKLLMTALVYQGASGCPVCWKGRVVGVINSGYPSAPGKNFAIPSSQVCAMMATLFLQDSTPYSIVQMPNLGVVTIPASQQMLIVSNFEFRQDNSKEREKEKEKEKEKFRGGLKVIKRKYGNLLYEPGDLQEGDILYKVVFPDILSLPKSDKTVHPTNLEEVYQLVQKYKNWIHSGTGGSGLSLSSVGTISSSSSSSTTSAQEEVDRLFGGKQQISPENERKEIKESKESKETKGLKETKGTKEMKQGESILIKPSSFRKRNEINPEQEKTEKGGITAKKVYYFPFPYDPNGPYLQLSWINAGDDTIFLERQETPSSPWKQYSLTEDTRNFTLKHILSRIPPGIPLTLFVWRDGKSVVIRRLNEAFQESSKGIQIFYTPPETEEENYVLFNGLGLMDLNINQIVHCMSDLRQLGACYPLLPYLDPKEKKYEPTVIVTNVLSTAQLSRKGQQQVHVFDRLVSLEAKFAIAKNSHIGFWTDETKFNPIPIRSISELKEAIIKLARATVTYYKNEVQPHAENYKKFIQDKFSPLLNSYTEMNESRAGADILQENWDCLVYVSLNFKGDEQSTCFFPKVLRQDAQLFEMNQTKPSKFAKKLKKDVYEALANPAHSLGIKKEIISSKSDETLVKQEKEKFPISLPPPPTEPRPQQGPSVQEVSSRSEIVVPTIRYSSENMHPASLPLPLSRSRMRAKNKNLVLVKPLQFICSHQHYDSTDLLKHSDRDSIPTEKASDVSPATIISPVFEPCKRCAGA